MKNKKDQYIKNEEDFGPLASPEDLILIKEIYDNNPSIQFNKNIKFLTDNYFIADHTFDADQPWIQTYSGVRFTPTKPNPKAIVIQDIAHALSMQCRFTGHSKSFISVAQHSVMVSYVCDMKDALWGLLHDCQEAYISDISAPLKHSGKYDDYLAIEKIMQIAVCQRFNLLEEEPESVKIADKIMLATEARDFMSPMRSDWKNQYQPLMFKLESLSPAEAKLVFIKRFFELTGKPENYDEYLRIKNDPTNKIWM